MPIYEYVCAACGNVTESITLAHAADSNVTCSACGGAKLEKKVSAPAIPKIPSRPSGKTCCGRADKCGDGPSCCGAG